MEVNYLEKYLKYKTKYLSLKDELHGGGLFSKKQEEPSQPVVQIDMAKVEQFINGLGNIKDFYKLFYCLYNYRYKDVSDKEKLSKIKADGIFIDKFKKSFDNISEEIRQEFIKNLTFSENILITSYCADAVDSKAAKFARFVQKIQNERSEEDINTYLTDPIFKGGRLQKYRDAADILTNEDLKELKAKIREPIRCLDYMWLIFFSEIGQTGKKDLNLAYFLEEYFTGKDFKGKDFKYYAEDYFYNPKSDNSHMKNMKKRMEYNALGAGYQMSDYIFNIKGNPEKGREFINNNILTLFYLVMLYKDKLYHNDKSIVKNGNRQLAPEEINESMKGLIEAINEELKSFAATTKTGTIFKKCEECDFYKWCENMLTQLIN
jgi:hypothetical protein